MDHLHEIDEHEDPGWALLRQHLGLPPAAPLGERADINEQSTPRCCDHPERRYVHDRVRGALICTGCAVSRPGPMRSGYIQFSRRSVYDPLYHWHERLTMVMGTDTRIPDEEFKQITVAISKVRRRCRITQRRHIRMALHSLNLRDGTKYWTKKWLERWPQIIMRIHPREVSPPRINVPSGLLDDLFLRTKDAWRQVRGRFAPRSHMPNFSYMFVQILSFVGIPYEQTLPWFHQLQPDKLKRTERYWRAICEVRRWPFVSIIPKLKIKGITNVPIQRSK